MACSPRDSHQTFPQAKKLNTNVSIPREPLDLKQLGLISENATDDTAPIYDLYGVSNHMGSTEVDITLQIAKMQYQEFGIITTIAMYQKVLLTS